MFGTLFKVAILGAMALVDNTSMYKQFNNYSQEYTLFSPELDEYHLSYMYYNLDSYGGLSYVGTSSSYLTLSYTTTDFITPALTNAPITNLEPYEFVLASYQFTLNGDDDLGIIFVPLFNQKYCGYRLSWNLSNYYDNENNFYVGFDDYILSEGEYSINKENINSLAYYQYINYPTSSSYNYGYVEGKLYVQLVDYLNHELPIQFTLNVPILNNLPNQSSSSYYNQGYNDGYSQGQSDSQVSYQQGYSDGYNAGVDIDTTAATIFTGIIDVGLLPINVFLAILNFEVFGINIGGFVSAVMTIAIVVIVMRVILGGKNND